MSGDGQSGTAGRLLALRRRGKLFGIEQGGNGPDAGHQALVELLLLEVGRDHIGEDALGLGIGEHALHAAAGLDAQAPHGAGVIGRHQQQHAIVDALAAELPGIGHAEAVLLDLFGRGALDRQYRDLAAGTGFVVGQHGLELGALFLGQHAGLVDQVRAQRRHRHQLGLRLAGKGQHQHDGPQGAHEIHITCRN